MIVCCNTCSIIYCGDCMDPENDDPIKHTWRECDGCGPQARGMPRDEFKRVTGESWAHCYGCLRTYWGAADEPLLCAGCHDQLEAGGSVWVSWGSNIGWNPTQLLPNWLITWPRLAPAAHAMIALIAPPRGHSRRRRGDCTAMATRLISRIGAACSRMLVGAEAGYITKPLSAAASSSIPRLRPVGVGIARALKRERALSTFGDRAGAYCR